MINNQLYAALKAAFGEVLVANEGEMPSVIPDRFSYPGWRIASSSEGTRGEQYHVNCPFCGDKRHRLYVSCLSYTSLKVNGDTLPPGPLMAYCQNENCMSSYKNREAFSGMLFDSMSSPKALSLSQAEEPVRDEVKYSSKPTLEGIRTWVPSYAPVDKNAPPAVLEYLQERRLSADDVNWLKIGWGPIQTRNGVLLDGCPWIIFPIIQNSQLVGVQARCLPKYMPKDFKMKYWFHPASRKGGAVFNLDVARSFGVGVLCEGVFDVASIGKPGICCFGHTPSIVQKRLVATVGDLLIWLPDTDKNPQCDPVDIARRVSQQWNDAGAFRLGVHVVLLPEKDAGSLTRLQVWQEIMKQVPYNVGGYLMKNVVERL